MNSTSRPVMNPPAQAEARNRDYAAPRQADHDAPCRGLDRRVFMAGGLARNRHQPLIHLPYHSHGTQLPSPTLSTKERQ
jgi:hypothetical protein